MRIALLTSFVLLASCVDPADAEKSFCAARPELCPIDSGSSDAGLDAGCPNQDEFGGTTWDSCFTAWDRTNFANPRLENGSLVIDQPGPGLSWSNGNGGSLLYQEVTGNFVAEVRARIVLPTDGGILGSYTAAGLLAVDPRAPERNNRLISVGTLATGQIVGVLSQKTEDAGSNFTSTQTSQTEMVLRLCRIGTTWYVYWRALDAGTATLMPAPPLGDGGLDIPATLWVGPGAYNLQGPVARLEHDYFRLSTAPRSQGDCGTMLP